MALSLTLRAPTVGTFRIRLATVHSASGTLMTPKATLAGTATRNISAAGQFTTQRVSLSGIAVKGGAGEGNFFQLIDCDSVADWRKAYGSDDVSTITLDTGAKQEGTGSIKITKSGSTNGVCGIEYPLAAAFDFSLWQYVTLWAYLPTDSLFDRLSLYLLDASGNYNYYYSYKYEGAYEAEDPVFYSGWNYKMYSLSSRTGGSPTPADLTAITVVRLRFQYSASYAGAYFYVDDIRVRDISTIGETGGAWSPPNSNQVFGVQAIETDDGLAHYMRLWNTMRTLSEGRGVAIYNRVTPSPLGFRCRVRLTDATSCARLIFDWMSLSEYSSVYLGSAVAGIEQVGASVPGGRIYSEGAIATTPGTWYTLQANVTGENAAVFVNGVQLTTLKLHSRTEGSFGLEARNETFGATPAVVSADFDNVSVAQALDLSHTKYYVRIRTRDVAMTTGEWSAYGQANDALNNWFVMSRGAAGQLTTPKATLSGVASRAIAVSGTLTTPKAALAGTAAITEFASGTLATPKATLAGTAIVIRLASGTLTTPKAALSGTTTKSTSASGTLTTPKATLSGAAKKSISASGTLTTPKATLAGVTSGAATVLALDGRKLYVRIRCRDASSIVSDWSAYSQVNDALNNWFVMAITASGTLSTPKATLSGEAATSFYCSGTLSTPKATLAGAARKTCRASGTLTTPKATLAGATVSGTAASGTITTPKARLSGTARRTVNATGELTTPKATLSGVADTSEIAIEVYVDSQIARTITVDSTIWKTMTLDSCI